MAARKRADGAPSRGPMAPPHPPTILPRAERHRRERAYGPAGDEPEEEEEEEAEAEEAAEAEAEAGAEAEARAEAEEEAREAGEATGKEEPEGRGARAVHSMPLDAAPRPGSVPPEPPATPGPQCPCPML